MALPPELLGAIEKNSGLVTTAQATAIGVSRQRLRLMVSRGELVYVSHGVYVLPERFVDGMHAAQLRRPAMIFSHEAALFLHNLTDLNLARYVVTVPSGYNTRRLHSEGIETYTIKRELHLLGATQVESGYGHNMVTAYDMERTICDCIRSRNRMDIAIVTDAVKMYVRRRDKDLPKLMRMAAVFHVDKHLRGYLEVLL
jgi:predicted transcriptional regulator of viral defense system